MSMEFAWQNMIDRGSRESSGVSRQGRGAVIALPDRFLPNSGINLFIRGAIVAIGIAAFI